MAIKEMLPSRERSHDMVVTDRLAGNGRGCQHNTHLAE